MRRPLNALASDEAGTHTAALSWLVVACAVATACNRVYSAPSPNVPLFQAGGQVTAAGDYGTNGATLQAGYAAAPRLGLIAGGSYASRGRADETSEATVLGLDQPIRRFGHGHAYGELGAGPVFPVRRRMRLELFLGLGYGHSAGQTPSGVHLADITGRYWAPFVQADVGNVSDQVEWGFASRVVALDWAFHSLDGAPLDEGRFIVAFQETGLLRVGPKPVKLQAELGVNVTTDDGRLPLWVTSPEAFVTIGLFTRFGGEPVPQHR